MQMTTWHPFREMDDMFRKYSRLFPATPAATGDNDKGITATEWSPSADISETKKEYVVKAELPEVDKKDISVTLDEGVLTIEGERKLKKEEDDETYHRVESFYGNFRRSFSLPKDIDEANIKADCKDGVLRVHLPKTKPSEPNAPSTITVN